MANEIQFGSRKGQTLTYRVESPDGTEITGTTPLVETDIGVSGHYVASDANISVGDMQLVKDSAGNVVGKGLYEIAQGVMRGTDGANTTVPLAAAADQAEHDQTQTDIGALPTALENAIATWDRELTGLTHNIPTSGGKRLREMATNVVVSGTSPNTGGTANTAIRIELDEEASGTDGNYDPANILVWDGVGAGQSRQIWEYDGANKYAYINRDWKVIPGSDAKYIIYGSSGNTHINEGLCGGGTLTTIILNTLASDDDGIYNGQIIFLAAGIGQDQAAIVKSYDGATHTATLEKPWVIIPTNAGTVYSVLPYKQASATDTRIEMDSNSTRLAAIEADTTGIDGDAMRGTEDAATEIKQDIMQTDIDALSPDAITNITHITEQVIRQIGVAQTTEGVVTRTGGAEVIDGEHTIDETEGLVARTGGPSTIDGAVTRTSGSEIS